MTSIMAFSFLTEKMKLLPPAVLSCDVIVHGQDIEFGTQRLLGDVARHEQ
jgi:hypothetical protein